MHDSMPPSVASEATRTHLDADWRRAAALVPPGGRHHRGGGRQAGEVLAPSAAARVGRATAEEAVEAGMRSCQNRGGEGSPRRGPTPCPDGVLVGRGRQRAQRGTSVVGGGRNRSGVTDKWIPHFAGQEIRGPLENWSEFGSQNRAAPNLCFGGPNFGAMAGDALIGSGHGESALPRKHW
jgi:hypothetical protein